MKRAYLVHRIFEEGAKAPLRTVWWPRHGRACSSYLRLALSENQRASCRRGMLAVAREYESLFLGGRSGLMVEHAALEMDLVDRSVSGQVEAVRETAGRLHDNARAIGKALAQQSPGFPEVHHLRLFGFHISGFAQEIGARIMEDGLEGAKIEAARLSNVLALAGLMTEWSL